MVKLLLGEVTVKIPIQLITKPLGLATEKKGFGLEKSSSWEACNVASLVIRAQQGYCGHRKAKYRAIKRAGSNKKKASGVADKKRRLYTWNCLKQDFLWLSSYKLRCPPTRQQET